MGKGVPPTLLNILIRFQITHSNALCFHFIVKPRIYSKQLSIQVLRCAMDDYAKNGGPGMV